MRHLFTIFGSFLLSAIPCQGGDLSQTNPLRLVVSRDFGNSVVTIDFIRPDSKLLWRDSKTGRVTPRSLTPHEVRNLEYLIFYSELDSATEEDPYASGLDGETYVLHYFRNGKGVLRITRYKPFQKGKTKNFEPGSDGLFDLGDSTQFIRKTAAEERIAMFMLFLIAKANVDLNLEMGVNFEE